MKYLKQFGIIMAISLVGEICNYLIPLPIPASIYGLGLLLGLLLTGKLRLDQVESVGDFLLEIMPIMFIPGSVAILNSWGIFKTIWIPVCVISVASTVIVMVVTGKTADIIIGRGKKKDGSVD